MRISDWSSDVCSSDLDLPNRSLRHRQFLVPNEVEGDIDDHIFLAADHPPPAELDQDLAGIETILFGRLFGMAQETGINACIAQAESLAIDAHRAVLQWPHNIFRGVHQAQDRTSTRLNSSH